MDAMGQFREEVIWAVNTVLDAMGTKVHFEVEVPDQDKADLAIPCFPMAKVLRKNPVEIANQIVSELPPMPTIEKVWADRGYLNFKINEEFLALTTVRAIISNKGSFGKGMPKESRVLLEHTSVNPTGPLHVGRARNPLDRRYPGPMPADLRVRCHNRVSGERRRQAGRAADLGRS